MSPARRIVQLALAALVLLFAAWFGLDGEWVALAVFALPPLMLAAWLPRSPALAGFWAGVLALLWFSHGVMVAWSRPPERGFALAEVALALAVVLAASVSGLRSRFTHRKKAGRVP